MKAKLPAAIRLARLLDHELRNYLRSTFACGQTFPIDSAAIVSSPVASSRFASWKRRILETPTPSNLRNGAITDRTQRTAP
jgi:hypothetical protein